VMWHCGELVRAWAQGLLSTLGCLLSTTYSETACRLVSFLASLALEPKPMALA